MSDVERRREDDSARRGLSPEEQAAIAEHIEHRGVRVVPSCRRGTLPHAMTRAERRGHEAGLGHTRRAAWRRAA